MTNNRTTELSSLVKEKYGVESVAHLTCISSTKEEIDIIYATRPISRQSKEEQKAKVAKIFKEMTKELVDSFIQKLSSSENDIIENEQENELSNYGTENNLETIRKSKENLIKLKQELIDSERNKETTEEPKTKSMK